VPVRNPLAGWSRRQWPRASTNAGTRSEPHRDGLHGPSFPLRASDHTSLGRTHNISFARDPAVGAHLRAEHPKPQSKAPRNTQITNVHNSVAGMQCAE
jgi:hypothetical protein